MKNFYLVLAGEITQVDPCMMNYENTLEKLHATEHNTNEWIVAYAENEEEALNIADLHDTGDIEQGNIWCDKCGKAHVAAEI